MRPRAHSAATLGYVGATLVVAGATYCCSAPPDPAATPRAAMLRTSSPKSSSSGFFAGVDPKLVAVARGAKLPEDVVHLVDGHRRFERLYGACRRARRGISRIGGARFDEWLERSRGRDVVIVVIGDDLPMPESYWPDVTGSSVAEVRARLKGADFGRVTLPRPGGGVADVFLAATHAEMNALLEKFDCKLQP